jgi:hypothetical protein
VQHSIGLRQRVKKLVPVLNKYYFLRKKLMCSNQSETARVKKVKNVVFTISDHPRCPRSAQDQAQRMEEFIIIPE